MTHRDPVAERERLAEHYRANRDSMRERMAEYYRANRTHRIRAASERKFLIRMSRPVMYGSGQNSAFQLKVLKNDPCSYCGGVSTGVDHIIPRTAGGVDDFTNVTGACVSCNRQKSSKSMLTHMLEMVS